MDFEELEAKARFSGWDRQDSAKIILSLIELIRENIPREYLEEFYYEQEARKTEATAEA